MLCAGGCHISSSRAGLVWGGAERWHVTVAQEWQVVFNKCVALQHWAPVTEILIVHLSHRFSAHKLPRMSDEQKSVPPPANSAHLNRSPPPSAAVAPSAVGAAADASDILVQLTTMFPHLSLEIIEQLLVANGEIHNSLDCNSECENVA
jgi:hypothetical protein